MPEAQTLRWRKRPYPAIGAGGRLPRAVLLRRWGVALGLILLLVPAKIVVSHAVITPLTLAPPEYVIAPGLGIGPAPDDGDLQELATSFRVDGVVNLLSPDVAEQAAAASLHQSYLYLPLAPGTAPTWPQLRTLAAFMRGNTAKGRSVFVHDDVGGGRAVVTAAMLLLLRGETWPRVNAQLTRAELQTLSAGQFLAINQLNSALRQPGAHAQAGPYAAARIDPW